MEHDFSQAVGNTHVLRWTEWTYYHVFPSKFLISWLSPISWEIFSTKPVTHSAIWELCKELDLRMAALTQILTQTAGADVSVHSWAAQINHTLTLRRAVLCVCVWERGRAIDPPQSWSVKKWILLVFITVFGIVLRWHHRNVQTGTENLSGHITYRTVACCSC